MRYLILFGIIVAGAAASAAACMRTLGNAATILLGVLMTVAAVGLFILNKSDSVADTFLEKVADLLPPLFTGSIVIGWWLGYALYRMIARVLR